jgi:thioredoxin reductase (NADPH)
VPVAVIGSGPAGLSAALYGTRLGFFTVVFEGPQPGGQLTETGYVENWPGVGRERGPEIMNSQRRYVQQLGAEVVQETITNVDFSRWPYRLFTEDGHEITALSVIIATGSAPRVLAVPGEREYWGKGVTTCAICDAPYYKGKDVVVIGGGDSAVEEAQQLAPYAERITIMVRRDRLRASASMVARLEDMPNVHVEFNRQVRAVYGDGDKVTSIDISDAVSNETFNRPVDGVFLAVGHEPRTKVFANSVALDTHGYIRVYDCSQRTSRPGVFAAGDVHDSLYRQAGVAAGSGIKAAIEAAQFLQRNGWSAAVASAIKKRHFVGDKPGVSCVRELTSLDQLKLEVLKSPQPAIIDFYAHYCPPCMGMLPIYEAVARNFCDRVSFFKVDTASNPDIEEELQVQRVPCFVVYKDGQQIARYHSEMNKTQMIDFVTQVLQA